MLTLPAPLIEELQRQINDVFRIHPAIGPIFDEMIDDEAVCPFFGGNSLENRGRFVLTVVNALIALFEQKESASNPVEYSE